MGNWIMVLVLWNPGYAGSTVDVVIHNFESRAACLYAANIARSSRGGVRVQAAECFQDKEKAD